MEERLRQGSSYGLQTNIGLGKTLTIAGGTFSSIPDLKWISGGYAPFGDSTSLPNGDGPTSCTMKNGPITLNTPTKNGYTFTGRTGSSGTAPSSYNINSENFSPDVPTREGCDFEGWLLSGDNTGGVSTA